MSLVTLVFYSFLAGAGGAGSDSFSNHYLHGPLAFLTGFSPAPTGEAIVVDYIIAARHRGKR